MQRSGKHVALINSLPKNPSTNIVWIVYDENMVAYIQDMISDIKGKDYLQFVKVVPRSSSSKFNGKVYFDPFLMDSIGNGLT